MPCIHPLPAWKTVEGAITLTSREYPENTRRLLLPCGKCVGCRQAKALAYALRCTHEATQHSSTLVTTLTYDEENLPATLSRRDLTLFLKRLRKTTAVYAHKQSQPNRTIRFFASGEYGEDNGRPHYHALLFGVHQGETDLVHKTWGYGITHTETVSPAAIAYVAGYTAKKYETPRFGPEYDTEWVLDIREEKWHKWQPPFLQMSRGGGKNKHGIGGHARQWPHSWRNFAILNGNRMPVPRYYHDAWLATATFNEKDQLEYEKHIYTITHQLTDSQKIAQKQIAEHKQQLAKERRKL